jgi:hypothetical protein
MAYYYYFINHEFFDYILEYTRIYWVGDQAASIYLNRDKNKSELYRHSVCVFDKPNGMDGIIDNENVFTILNEAYPLWNDDYNNKGLQNAFKSLEEQLIHKGERFNIIIGNPAELLVQNFLKFYTKRVSETNKKPPEEHSDYDLSAIFLKNQLNFKDINKEINDLKRKMEKHLSFIIEIDPIDFDWQKFVEKNKEITQMSPNKNKIMADVSKLVKINEY